VTENLPVLDGRLATSLVGHDGLQVLGDPTRLLAHRTAVRTANAVCSFAVDTAMAEELCLSPPSLREVFVVGDRVGQFAGLRPGDRSGR